MLSQPADGVFLPESSALPLAELRPSLRAAIDLEALHGGFPALLSKLAECDTATIKAVITATAPKRVAACICETMARAPLGIFLEAVIPVLIAVIERLLPKSKGQTQNTDTKPLDWQDAFEELYRIGTGWLGWPPATTWAASPQEIIDAFDGHVAKLKAIHGSDEGNQDAPVDPDQAAKNIEEGLDPEYDRAGLQRLMKLSAQKVGDTI